MKAKPILWQQIIAGLFLLFIASACHHKTDKHSGVSQTDLYTNTKGDIRVFLGANVPFGAVQLGPLTRGAHEGIGYHYNDSIITGLALSYTEKGEDQEINRNNDIRFFPTTQGEREAKFLHKYEVVKPGYYSVYMHEADIAVELTASKHVGYQRYFFPTKDSVQVVIDREFILKNDTVIAGQTPDLYFVAQFSLPIQGSLKENAQETTLFFDTTDQEMLYIKVGVSTKSAEDAESKIKEELPDWDFEATVAHVHKVWNDYLVKE